jgi:hypothetical protein
METQTKSSSRDDLWQRFDIEMQGNFGKWWNDKPPEEKGFYRVAFTEHRMTRKEIMRGLSACRDPALWSSPYPPFPNQFVALCRPPEQRSNEEKMQAALYARIHETSHTPCPHCGKNTEKGKVVNKSGVHVANRCRECGNDITFISAGNRDDKIRRAEKGLAMMRAALESAK